MAVPVFFFFFLLPTDIAVQQYSISENSECLHNLFRMEIAYENIVLCDAHTHWYTLHIIHETIYPLLGLFTDSKCMFFFSSTSCTPYISMNEQQQERYSQHTKHVTIAQFFIYSSTGIYRTKIRWTTDESSGIEHIHTIVPRII